MSVHPGRGIRHAIDVAFTESINKITLNTNIQYLAWDLLLYYFSVI